MPYVRARTFIQRAPRLVLGRRGMGDAQCPSLEQLQGIVDSNDPCQNPIAALPLSTVPTLIAPGSLTTPAQQAAANLLLAGLQPMTTVPAASSPLASFVQNHSGALIAAGVGLLAIAVLKAVR